MTTESALLTGNGRWVYNSIGFCFGGLVLEVESNALLTTGYLSATTFAMGFGLLSITIASFVWILISDHYLVSNVRTGQSLKR